MTNIDEKINRLLTKEQQEWLKTNYELFPREETAHKLNISRTFLSRIVNKWGIQKRGRMNTRKKLSIEQEAWLKENYAIIKTKEICSKLKISNTTLFVNLRRLNIPIRRGSKEIELNDEEVVWLRQNYGKMHTRDICSFLDISYASIYNLLDKYNIPTLHKRKKIKLNPEEEQWFKENYSKKGNQEIAKVLNISHKTIYFLAKIFGLKCDTKLSKKNIEFIKNNYYEMGANRIAEHFRVKPVTILNIAKKFELKTKKKTDKWNKLDKEKLLQLLDSGISFNEIVKVFPDKKLNGILLYAAKWNRKNQFKDFCDLNEPIVLKYCEYKLKKCLDSTVNRELDADITIEDLMELMLSQKWICHYSGILMTMNSGDFSVSIDRIDSNKGYLKGNIVLCCSIINQMKLDLNKETFINTCKAIANHC